MDNISIITSFFTMYFVLLVFLTIYKKEVTTKGLFYSFALILSFFFSVLLLGFSTIIIFNKFCDFKIFIVNNIHPGIDENWDVWYIETFA